MHYLDNLCGKCNVPVVFDQRDFSCFCPKCKADYTDNYMNDWLHSHENEIVSFLEKVCDSEKVREYLLKIENMEE